MALVSMRELLDHAAANGYGIPAFNVNNLEQVQAVMSAADEVGAPVILQASAGARKYAGEAFIKHLILAAIESYPHIPLVMHQDHGQSPDVCQGAIKLGFSSVMMDGSLMSDGKTIASYDYNADVTRTQLDALAIAIGTSHGAYKFTRKPTGDILAIDRVKAINKRIPNTHLVMHGSSSVPQELLAIIREFGGNMKETYGVPVEEIQKAIKFGVRKINIDTDIRLAMTGAVRKYMAQNPEKFDARDWLKPAREAAKALCKQRYIAFGCEGQGSKIKGHSLREVAAQYARGELAQVVN